MKNVLDYILEKLYISNSTISEIEINNEKEFKRYINGKIAQLTNPNEVLDLSNIVLGPSITNLNGFLKDINVKYINVSDWDLSNITSVESLFENTTNLIEVYGLETWDISNIKTFGRMFYNSGIKNLNIENWKIPNNANLSFMFFKCKNLNLDISSWNLDEYKHKYNMTKYSNVTI